VAKLSNEQLDRLPGLVRAQEKHRIRVEQAALLEEKPREERKCPVCLDALKGCMLGCGHQLCPGCAELFKARSLPCPLCRAPVQTVTRFFPS
jgi:hypothetical protein